MTLLFCNSKQSTMVSEKLQVRLLVNEDQSLLNLIMMFNASGGYWTWDLNRKEPNCQRLGAALRLRWNEKVNPELNKNVISEAESEQILEKLNQHGDQYRLYQMKGRSVTMIKFHLYTLFRAEIRRKHDKHVALVLYDVFEGLHGKASNGYITTAEWVNGCTTDERWKTTYAKLIFSNLSTLKTAFGIDYVEGIFTQREVPLYKKYKLFG